MLKIIIILVLSCGVIGLMYLIETGEKNDTGEGNADSSGASGMGPDA